MTLKSLFKVKYAKDNPNPNHKVLTLRIPQELYLRLDHTAFKRGMSFNSFLNEILTQFKESNDD